MAKVKVINNTRVLDSNLNGLNFNNITSNTIFSFGSFTVTTNFDGRNVIDFSKKLNSFSRAITLDSLNLTDKQSDILEKRSNNVVLNLNKSKLSTFIRYGSGYEFLRSSVENIIVNYPGSLYFKSDGNATFSDYSYNPITNISKFKAFTNKAINKFGIVYSINDVAPDNNEVKNLNLSYVDYIIWTSHDSTNYGYNIIGFTGTTKDNDNIVEFEVNGDVFNFLKAGVTSGSIDFHVRPNNVIFEEFRSELNPYEKYMLSNRDSMDGFSFNIKTPNLLETGDVVYSDDQLTWTTSDGYNIDVDTAQYRSFLESLLTIGSRYDSIKTDLIARFLTPTSLKTYDFTDNGKMNKLLRSYGYEFDQLRIFIDSLVNINKVTYDKVENTPDQLIINLAKSLGWEYTSILNEDDLMGRFLNIDDVERNLDVDLLPAEIDIELWRRILINTNYYWRSKGTREAIISIFKLIGIPKQFINITEYVYTVEDKINPNKVELSEIDFPTNSLPYDNSGYPKAPVESNSFYFQADGNSDNGQRYMDVFRDAGFDLTKNVDNKKSWVYSGATTRKHYTTPNYYQEDSKLVLNTKEISISLDAARAVEEDVFDYLKNVDYPINSTGYTMPISFVNVSLGVNNSQGTFQLPNDYKALGKMEVRYNGILLNAPREYDGSTMYDETTESDYTINSDGTFTIHAIEEGDVNFDNGRDVVQVSFVNGYDYDEDGDEKPITGDTSTGYTFTSGNTGLLNDITVEYIVTRIKPDFSGTKIPLPSKPNGDVQVTINGIALTKGTNQFTADYIVNPNNSNEIIIQNQDVISYLQAQPFIQVAFINVQGNDEVGMRNEIIRVDSFNTSKIYFNESINKHVLKLNYKVNSNENIKVLVNGIALEPGTDYKINNNNLYEVILPKGIKYGDVISAYYLVSNTTDIYDPIIDSDFGLGDVSDLSYMEFVDLVNRKLINPRNRKVVTDFKGGWYPTLLYVYNEYLKRSDLPDDNPLKSNGYSFDDLYSFISRYDTYFKKFMGLLLPATVIIAGSGRGGGSGGGAVLIRNTIFTKQKFMYRRGVNINGDVEYLGDDGSLFKIKQSDVENIE